MMYNPLFVFLQSQKWYTFGLQFGIFMRYYLHISKTGIRHVFVQNRFGNRREWFIIFEHNLRTVGLVVPIIM